MNLVTGPEGTAAGVLIRAAEVVEGLSYARSRRVNSSDRDLARGPARLTVALGVDLADDGSDACAGAGAFRLLGGTPPSADMVRNGPRTGVGGDGAGHPWRFWIDGDRTVSPYRPHAPRRREPVRARPAASGTL